MGRVDQFTFQFTFWWIVISFWDTSAAYEMFGIFFSSINLKFSVRKKFQAYIQPKSVRIKFWVQLRHFKKSEWPGKGHFTPTHNIDQGSDQLMMEKPYCAHCSYCPWPAEVQEWVCKQTVVEPSLSSYFLWSWRLRLQRGYKELNVVTHSLICTD